VTGYGLAGHGWEIAERSGVTLQIDTALLPLYPGALEIAISGHRTGGDPRNRSYVGEHLTATADDAHVALCMDPQTSGGLLAAVTPRAAELLVATGAWTAVGEFTDGGPALQIV
jgi:selenide,water dikinase